MYTLVIFLGFAIIAPTQVYGYWDKTVVCPDVCKCRLEHSSETPIHRFMIKDDEIIKPAVPEAIVLENNDVYYDGDEFVFDESAYIRSAMCIIQTETTIETLIMSLPKDIHSIALLQASESGNKSIQMSAFNAFDELKILDIQSAQTLGNQKPCFVSLDIDEGLEKLEFLNLERVFIRNSNERLNALENDVFIYEFVQKNDDGHSLTLLEKRTGDKILPYKTYVENLKGEEGPLFMGFSSLLLLRIYESEIHHIHREMFAGLGNLNNLILQKNKLQFISDFAFYGAPNLKSLSLAWNNLLNVQITDLAGLLELEYLDLSHNNFTQLSELSLPPFPKLKQANFANNPITVVFPNTFEVMNTTYSLIVGGLDEPLTLQTNSFLGLNLLMSLKLLHLNIPLFERDILRGMPNLQVLVMTGNIPEIQYDAFLEVKSLDTLILSACNLSKLSVDSFIGLEKLRILDLSKNNLTTLTPGIFDVLTSVSELYLHNNHFQTLPQYIFSKLSTRLIRLNENPWHCSCDMSDWKPMIVNRIKQKTIKTCDMSLDKGLSCQQENKIYHKYVYENSVSPKCLTPTKYLNWSVFHVMRRQFKCVDYKPKLKKRLPKKRLRIVKVHEDFTNSDEEIDLTTMLSIETSTEIRESKSMNEDEFELKLQKDKMKRKYQRTMKMNKYKDMEDALKMNIQYQNIEDSLFPKNNLNYDNNNVDNSLFN